MCAIMKGMDPVAPITPDDPVSIDTFEAVMAAMDDLIGGDGTLAEAFNPNQPRFPKGHAKAGQWRPKLVTGAGGLAPGHLDRDIRKINDLIEQGTGGGTVVNVSPGSLDVIGQQVEKVALKYSARKVYEKRLEDIRAERTAIQDAKWDAYEKAWRAAPPFEERDPLEPEDFIDPKDAARLKEIAEEEIKLVKQRDFADRDAMLGVLQKIRPMGGKLNVAPWTENKIEARTDNEIEKAYREQELARGAGAKVLMQRDLEANLKQVLKLIPKAWLDDTNSKGTVNFLFSDTRAYADTREETPPGQWDEWKGARKALDTLAGEGYKLLGRDKKVSTFLMLEAPNGDVVALRSDGSIPKGVGEFSDTALVLSKEGTWTLPGFTEHATAKDAKKFVTPMKTLPPEPTIPSPSSAMGQNWDPYERMRTAVAKREQEGWKFVGMRGKWATLRKGDEEISLNWAGDPLTKQVGQGGKDRGLDPLNPYVVIPAPPVPSQTNTTIKIDPRPGDKDTLLHELCHRMEVVYGEQNNAGYHPLSMAMHSFFNSRTKGEETQKLRDLYPGYAYEGHEISKPDKFIDGYCGKIYKGESTELLTMGLQYLFFPRFGSNRDVNKDPAYRRLILGVMATL